MGTEAYRLAVVPAGDQNGQVSLVVPPGGVALPPGDLLGGLHRPLGKAAGAVLPQQHFGVIHHRVPVRGHIPLHTKFLLWNRC